MAVFYFLFQRSTEQMRKVPTIVLSITYKGVKFIDAANKVNYALSNNPALIFYILLLVPQLLCSIK